MKKLILITLFFVLNIELAHAGCSDLAILFSRSPDSMEVNELGTLKKCVSDELRKKLFPDDGPHPMPELKPPPAPAPAPPPVPMEPPPGQ